MPKPTTDLTSVRIDRWLWAARFFKTRSLAKAAVEAGKIDVAGHKPKPSKEITLDMQVHIRAYGYEKVVIVTGLADKRGSASIAQTLYQETTASIEARATARANERMLRAGLRVPTTKPDKHQRQALKALKQTPDESQ